jgi:FAD/FMN-containing dehydrogenase
MPEIHNWNRSAFSHPAEVVRPASMAELIALVRATLARADGPKLRAVGHLHSMNECFGTPGVHIDMTALNRCTVDQAQGVIVAEAGATLLDIAGALGSSLQIPVMPEIGNATAGSVACCGTKDSSVGTGPGQVSSGVVAVKMVNAQGILEDIDERRSAAEKARLRDIRSSYGLLGVICEVTFKTEPRVVFKHEYEVLSLEPVPSLAAVRKNADAVLAFMQPYSKQILVERRFIDSAANRSLLDHVMIQRQLRGLAWEHLATQTVNILTSLPFARRFLEGFDKLTGAAFENLLSGFRASRADCMVDFSPDPSDPFDFTFWAYPETSWEAVVPAYLRFCNEQLPFRASLFTEVYLISQDDKAALSFCPSSNVFTLDSVDHRAQDGEWHRFNRGYNDLAVQLGGCPLLNQTKQLSRRVVRSALGNRWTAFGQLVAAEDPNGRFGNSFFDALL